MLVDLSPRVAAVLAGVVLVLGPIALIEVYRGLAAPAGAGVIAPAPQVPPRKEPVRVLPPAPEAFRAELDAASLFAPSGAGYRQTFSRPPSAPPLQADARLFEFDAPAVFAPPGAVEAATPEARRPKQRERVTRSPSCDSKMPEDSWLDVCG